MLAVQAQEGDGDDPDYEEMISARVRSKRNRQEVLLDNYRVFSINGTRYSPERHGNLYYESLPGGTGYTPRELDISNALTTPFGGMFTTYGRGENGYNSIPIVNRSSNNLGGMGPNNGLYCYRRGGVTIPSYGTACDPGNYQSQPNFIRMNDVMSVDGARIAMRIDNSSEYKVAKPAMNDFNGFNFQINLQSLFNSSAGNPGSFQPFQRAQDEAPTFWPVLTRYLNDVLDINLNAENSNQVSLFFSFFDQDTGAPVELDEVRATSFTQCQRGFHRPCSHSAPCPSFSEPLNVSLMPSLPSRSTTSTRITLMEAARSCASP